MSLRAALLLVIAVLGLGGTALFLLFAVKPILNLRRQTLQPGLIVSDRQGRARWSGAVLPQTQVLGEARLRSDRPVKSEQEQTAQPPA